MPSRRSRAPWPARTARWSSPPMSGATPTRSRLSYSSASGSASACWNRRRTSMNFPHDNPLYQGSHWNHPFQNAALAEADVDPRPRQRRAVGALGQPAEPGGADLSHRRRPAEAVDAALVHQRARHLPRRRADRARAAEPASRRPADRCGKSRGARALTTRDGTPSARPRFARRRAPAATASRRNS